jgi:hypothetical protein
VHVTVHTAFSLAALMLWDAEHPKLAHVADSYVHVAMDPAKPALRR